MSDEEEIFEQALRISEPRERETYLDRACAAQPHLRQEVQALLKAHEQTAGILESPVAQMLDAPPPEQPGTLVGNYKLLEQIGEGGMGVVYMAEQLRPVKRRVALKILKAGLDTKQVIARFEAERQALAMMDHPNIARVFDAGVTETGRPYFAMELVRGIPITQFCDQDRLTTRQRLELFVQVCQAVQHAHQKGIIHRDLKPTNVLVTLADDGKPVSKIIDFGIAKATGGQRLVDQTLFTELRQLIGTPLYMSPEQAERSSVQDVDTRSDVYSLGVLLYELLTGTTPFDKNRLATAAYDEVRRIIREEEPPRPSTRLSTLSSTITSISAQRQTDPKKLRTIVRGELDWIVMKALEKDRARRYETANGLARDVERYLADKPVEACPPSRLYRARKFARRNKAALATGSLVAAVLVIATVMSMWSAVRAKRAERQVTDDRDQIRAAKDRAEEQAVIAKAISDFLNKDVLGQANVVKQLDRTSVPDSDLKVRDALDRAAGSIASRFVNQPLVEAATRSALGDAYEQLGEYEKAEQQLQQALPIQRKLLGDFHPDTCETFLALCDSYANSERYDEAEALLAPALQSQRKNLGVKHRITLKTMTLLGRVYLFQLKFAEGDRLLREAIEGQRTVFGEADPVTLDTTVELAVSCEARSEYVNAENLLRGVLDVELKMHHEHGFMSFLARRYLGLFYRRQAMYDKSEPMLLKALDDARRMEQAATPYILWDLVDLYNAQQRYEEAEKKALDAVEETRKAYGEQHLKTSQAMLHLGKSYVEQHQYEKAEKIYLPVYEDQRKRYGENDARIADALGDLGFLYEQELQFKKAEPFLIREPELNLRAYGEQDLRTLLTAARLGFLYSYEGNFDEADRLLRQWLEGTSKLFGEQHPDTFRAMVQVAGFYERWKRFDDAVRLRRKLLAIVEKLRGPDNFRTGIHLTSLGRVVRSAGRPDEAEQLLRRAVAILRKQDNQLLLAEALDELGHTVRDPQEKEKLYSEDLAIYEKLLGPDSPTTAYSYISLGNLLRSQKKPTEAEKFYRLAIDGSGKELRPYTFAALDGLAALYQDQKNWQQAENIYQEELRRKSTIGAPPDEQVARVHFRLGVVAQAENKYADAEREYHDAVDLARQVKSDELLRQIDESLVKFYRAAHNQQQLAETEARLWAAKIPALTESIEAGGEGNPKLPDLLRDRAELYTRLAKSKEAAADLEKLTQLVIANVPSALPARALYYARVGRFQKAADDFAKLIDLHPENHLYWHEGLMPLLVELGHMDGFHRRLRDELSQFAKTTDGLTAHRVSKDVFMVPEVDVDQLAQGVALAGRATELLSAKSPNSGALQTRGMADYRIGHFEDAIRRLGESSSLTSNPIFHVENNLFIAMAHQRLGNHVKAVSTVQQAVQQMNLELGDNRMFQDEILCRALRREAEDLINGKSPMPSTAPCIRPTTAPVTPGVGTTPGE